MEALPNYLPPPPPFKSIPRGVPIKDISTRTIGKGKDPQKYLNYIARITNLAANEEVFVWINFSKNPYKNIHRRWKYMNPEGNYESPV